MSMLIVALAYLVLTCALTVFRRSPRWKALPRWLHCAIPGVAFGVIACMATEMGWQVEGVAVANLRDSGPVCAGLFFNAPAGIIAGLIGGIYRLFWGAPLSTVFSLEWVRTMFSVTAVGGFSRAACVLGTVVAGFVSAAARRILFEDKRAPIFGALATAITVESFHLLMIFVTRLNYLQQGVALLMRTSLPMIIGNAVVASLASLLVFIICGEKRPKRTEEPSLSLSFRLSIMTTIMLCFMVTIAGTLAVEYKQSVKQAEATLQKNLYDLSRKLNTDGGLSDFISDNFTWHVGERGGIIVGRYFYNNATKNWDIVVILNGEEYSKGTIITQEMVSHEKIPHTADNFFSAVFPIGGEMTPIYGMYLQPDDLHIIISYVPKDEATFYERSSMLLALFFDVLLFAVIYVTIWYLVKRLVINNLQRVNRALNEITAGNLNKEVDVRGHAEFSMLSREINKTVSALKRYTEEAEERMNKELEFARTIQSSSLPRVFPPFPGRTEFDIYAMMDTAREVGGDFYDFYFSGHNHLTFMIADVSGKGIPAAMFMMTSKTLLKNRSEQGGTAVGDVFTVVNSELCANNDAEMFVTAFQCDVDLLTGVMRFANAGHNPPLIMRAEGTFEYMKPRAGFVLAGMDGVKYRTQEEKLRSGDVVFLYTDGVTEATNAEMVLYGEARLRDALNRNRDLGVTDLCHAVKEDVDAFVGEAPQMDDITMLAFRYLGVPSMTLPEATVSDVATVTAFAESELEKLDCPMKIVFQIDVAIDEIFSNIVNHGYNGKPGPVTVHFLHQPEKHEVSLRFCDQGIPFNPLNCEEPDITLSAEERQIGGLGIFVVKKTMDDVRYKYEDGKNILTITKKLPG